MSKGKFENRREGGDASSDVTDLYDKRYSSEEVGKLSPYLSRFDPEYLIVPGEERVFMAGLKEMADSNPMMQELNSISKKVELWKKLKSGEKIDDVLQEIRNAYDRKEPLVITAVDFGCGDGRSLELWQKMADELKDFGIALRVKFYDVSKVGLKSLESRLTNPVLPEKYSDSLIEIYGENIVKKKKLRVGASPSQKDIDELKELYGEEIYRKKLKLGNLPIDEAAIDSDEEKQLARIYGKEIYQIQKNKEGSALRKEEQEVLQRFHGAEECERRKGLLDNKVPSSEKELNEEDKAKLEKSYSDKKIEERQKQIKFLQNVKDFLEKKKSLSEELSSDQLKIFSEDFALEMQEVEGAVGKILSDKTEELTKQFGYQKKDEIKKELDKYIDEQCKIYNSLITTYEKVFLEEDLRNLSKIFAIEDNNILEKYHSRKEEDIGVIEYQRRKTLDSITDIDRRKLQKCFENDETLVRDEERQKINLRTIYEEEDKNNLSDIRRNGIIEQYGDEYWGEDERRLTKLDVKNLQNIYGKRSYERRIGRGDFPTIEDYEELSKIYGDGEIRALKERMPKFIKMESEIGLIDQSNISCLGTYKYRNFEAEILLGNDLRTKPSDFKEAIGKVDMSLILYGSTSHIPDKELRKNFIKAVIDSTSGSFVATLPGRQGRADEIKEEIAKGYDGSEIKIKAAEFKGDNKIIPYAIYTHQTLTALLNEIYDELELERDNRESRIDRNKISVNIATKRNPADISKKCSDYIVDAILTPLANLALDVPCASESIKDARYFGVVAPGSAPKTSVVVDTFNPMVKKEEERNK
ncbi:MAG: hypothetical protein KGQ36_05590 [Rickettsiales bacterium]|nr:hypothetical protein [Rickettsiales bacterium]